MKYEVILEKCEMTKTEKKFFGIETKSEEE